MTNITETTLVTSEENYSGLPLTREDIVCTWRSLCGAPPSDAELTHYEDLAVTYKWSHYSLLMHVLALRPAQVRMGFNFIGRSDSFLPVDMRNGMRLFGPATDLFVTHQIKQSGLWEPDTESVIRHLVKPGMHVLDIGANVGYHMCVLAEIVAEKGKVYALEMAPLIVKCLRQTIAHNNLSHVTVFPFAASNTHETLNMTYNFVNYGGSYVWPPSAARPIDPIWDDVVQAAPLDDLLAGIPQLDFVKMDVEGHEGYALRGMRFLLDKFRPAMIFEFTPQSLRGKGTPPEAVLAELEELNYQFVPCDRAVASGDLEKSIREDRMESSSIMTMYGDRPGHVDLLALQNS